MIELTTSHPAGSAIPHNLAPIVDTARLAPPAPESAQVPHPSVRPQERVEIDSPLATLAVVSTCPTTCPRSFISNAALCAWHTQRPEIPDHPSPRRADPTEPAASDTTTPATTTSTPPTSSDRRITRLLSPRTLRPSTTRNISAPAEPRCPRLRTRGGYWRSMPGGSTTVGGSGFGYQRPRRCRRGRLQLNGQRGRGLAGRGGNYPGAYRWLRCRSQWHQRQRRCGRPMLHRGWPAVLGELRLPLADQRRTHRPRTRIGGSHQRPRTDRRQPDRHRRRPVAAELA